MFYEMPALCITEKVLTYTNWVVSAKSTLKSSSSFDSCSNGRRFFIHFEWINLAVHFFSSKTDNIGRSNGWRLILNG